MADTSTAKLTGTEMASLYRRLPIVISAAKRMRLKAKMKGIEVTEDPKNDVLQKQLKISANKANKSAEIADEIAKILNMRIDWRCESDTPDYTKNNWYKM